MRLIIILLLLTNCITLRKANYPVFLHDRINEEICAMNPDLHLHGIYRAISCDNAPKDFEFCRGEGVESYNEVIPYCSDDIEDYIGIEQSDFKP